MPSIKHTAIEVASLLAQAEAAAPSEELTALHKRLRRGLFCHAEHLGLSKADVVEIDGYIAETMAGTPKDEDPEGGGD